jgi:hypothetical protein
MSTDAQIESEIQAKGLTAPRVTPADIEAEIASEWYLTAADGAHVRFIEAKGDSPWGTSLEHLTFCVLILKNGFTVTGESACASPENYNAELDNKIARTKAIDKIWPLLGFRLRDSLSK